MSIMLRLLNRNLNHKLHNKNYNCVMQIVRTSRIVLAPCKIKYMPKENHDEHNMRRKRPQSPHLTIYAAELPSFLSITHRMTGAALAFYVATVGIAALALPPGELSTYILWIEDQEFDDVFIYAMRFVLAFPFCYHACNGVRHLLWDFGPTGILLSMRGVYFTGYLMLLCAISATAVFVFMY